VGTVCAGARVVPGFGWRGGAGGVFAPRRADDVGRLAVRPTTPRITFGVVLED
jgi:hypothetical protein